MFCPVPRSFHFGTYHICAMCLQGIPTNLFTLPELRNTGSKASIPSPRRVFLSWSIWWFASCGPPAPTNKRCCTSIFPPMHLHMFHRCTFTFSTMACFTCAYGARHPCVFPAPGFRHQGLGPKVCCNMGCCLLFLSGCILPTGCPRQTIAPPWNAPLWAHTALPLPTPLCTHHVPLTYATFDAKDRDSLLTLSSSPPSTFHYG